VEATAQPVEREMKQLKEAMKHARKEEQVEFTRSCRISKTACRRRSRLCSPSATIRQTDGYALTGTRRLPQST
jgi:hypothetical protein